jgi:hypothetical protein
MTSANAPAVRGEKPLEEHPRLSVDVPIEIDVSYCDVVPARDASHGGPFDLRFRGTRQPDGTLVRLHVPLLEIQEGLLAAKALAAPVNTAGVPMQDERPMLAVPLLQWALTITKRQVRPRTHWHYDVEVRSGAHVDLQHYMRAIRDAAERVAPMLTERGHAVGAVEIISIADTLFARRSSSHQGSHQGSHRTEGVR